MADKDGINANAKEEVSRTVDEVFTAVLKTTFPRGSEAMAKLMDSTDLESLCDHGLLSVLYHLFMRKHPKFVGLCAMDHLRYWRQFRDASIRIRGWAKRKKGRNFFFVLEKRFKRNGTGGFPNYWVGGKERRRRDRNDDDEEEEDDDVVPQPPVQRKKEQLYVLLENDEF